MLSNILFTPFLLYNLDFVYIFISHHLRWLWLELILSDSNAVINFKLRPIEFNLVVVFKLLILHHLQSVVSGVNSHRINTAASVDDPIQS